VVRRFDMAREAFDSVVHGPFVRETPRSWRHWARRFVSLVSTFAIVAVSLLSVGSTTASATVGCGYDAPNHGYDGAHHSVQLHTSDMALATSGEAPRGVQGTVATVAGPLSVLLSRFVAANSAGAELVPYSPQVASRNLLGQVGEDFATTPGGRTVSAHAADRIVNGAAGRPPTTLARVDSILDNPTALRYDPLRDTVRVSQGNAYVVVSGPGPGQHIVTVMIP